MVRYLQQLVTLNSDGAIANALFQLEANASPALSGTISFDFAFLGSNQCAVVIRGI